MKNSLVMSAIAVVAVGVVAFFAGTKFQSTQAANAPAGQNSQRRQGRNGGMTVGKVVSQDASSVTLQMQDGTTKLITISASTTVSKTATGSASDITLGQNVAAFGSTNSDGSVTAQNIQLNPLFRGGRGQDQAPTGK